MHNDRTTILSILLVLVSLFQVAFPVSACRFHLQPDSKWQFCECETQTSDSYVQMKCRRQDWITVPTLPSRSATQIDHKTTEYAIFALSIVDGGLVFIGQDTFKNQEIRSLDFTNNHLESINVNAFRGLESTLTQLILTRNSLVAIPIHSLTYLHQLQHLHLQHNRINAIPADHFAETQLKHLQYLYLDHNQIAVLPSQSLYRLPLQVLTLSNNRLTEIEKSALPSSTWFLDLKNNVLDQIPYMALRELKSLKTLDLQGNDIQSVHSDSDTQFPNEIDLRLSNNRIRVLHDNAFNSFRKFRSLDLSYNRIAKIGPKTFATISTMKQLDLSYNSLVQIPADALLNVAKSLRDLNLEENDLHKIPLAIQPLRVIEKLNINNNKLLSLDHEILANSKSALKELQISCNRLTRIPTDALKGMNKLHALDLSKNRIQSIGNLAFGDYESAGGSIVRLNLAGNHIQNITDAGAFLYMNSLAYLDLSYNQIATMSGLAFSRLTGLESLFLQNNALTQFPASGIRELKKLRYLLLDSNEIAELPDAAFSGTPQLQRLSITHNRLRSINARTFDYHRNLRSINFAFNRIHHLAAHAFTNVDRLERLFLDNNHLTTIDSLTFYNLTNLRQLSLNENLLTEIMDSSLTHLPVLEHLTIAHNQLHSIGRKAFTNVNKLENLDLSFNKLRTISFLHNSPALRNLDLSSNMIESIDLTQSKKSLRTLNLAHNRLQSIARDTLQNFDDLRHLDLSSNGLIEVSSATFVASPKLAIVSLAHNHLRKLWKGTFANQECIERLDLSWNALTSIDATIFGVDNLHELSLAHNELTEIPIRALSSVRNSISLLDLHGNRIRQLDRVQFQGLRNLTRLILSRNAIETIEENVFEQLPSLRVLDLSHNPVTSWNPHAFADIGHSIEQLILADTGLFFMPKIASRPIRHLNISHNKIYELNKTDLKQLSKLSTLDLSYNNIAELNPDLFAELTNLQHLNLSANPLQELNETHMRSFRQSLHMNNMPSLTRLPHPDEFVHLRHLRAFSMHDLPNVAYYNSSSILAHLPPLRALHIEMKDEELHSQLQFADLRLLRDLTITGRSIKTIHPGVFAHLRGYRMHVGIEHTSITHFDPSVFDTLTSMSFLALSLRHNRIETMNPFLYSMPPSVNQHGTILVEIQLMLLIRVGMFEHANLKRPRTFQDAIRMAVEHETGYSIEGNPIICDCRMKWLTEWFRQSDERRQESSSSLASTRCADQVKGGRTLRDYFYGEKGENNGNCGGEGSAESSVAKSRFRPMPKLSLLISFIACYFFV